MNITRYVDCPHCNGLGEIEESEAVRSFLNRGKFEHLEPEKREKLDAIRMELLQLGRDANRLCALMPHNEQKIRADEIAAEEMIERKAAKLLGIK